MMTDYPHVDVSPPNEDAVSTTGDDAATVAPLKDKADEDEAVVLDHATLQQQQEKQQQHQRIPAQTTNKKMKRSSHQKQQQERYAIHIVSAFYRPCEQKQQQQQQQHGSSSGDGGGSSCSSSGGGGSAAAAAEAFQQATMSKLYTRDVTPFVRALLLTRKQQEAAAAVAQEDHDMGVVVEHQQQQQQQQQQGTISMDNNCNNCTSSSSATSNININAVISISAMTRNGMKRSKICILDGMLQQQSMNSVFGDPCPGTSKRLYISYRVMENRFDDDHRDDDVNEPKQQTQQQDQHQDQDGKPFGKRSVLSKAAEVPSAAAPIHHVSFAEHEKVILNLMMNHRSRTFPAKDEEQDDYGCIKSKDGHDSVDNDHNSDEDALRKPPPVTTITASSGNGTTRLDDDVSNNGPSAWRLRASSSEIMLPLVMPYLQIKERMACRLVCRVWKDIIRDWGVATTIDVHDSSGTSTIVAMYPGSINHSNNNIEGYNNNNTINNNSFYSRPFLRGILKHSYSALHTLFLSGLHDINGPCDLHPSIPHLRKLRCLDVSHCIQLGDDTLALLALHCSATLQVLYVKALPLVTDAGMLAICQACRELQVLDISHLHELTDQTGMAIGQHLHKLRALYMRDNYKITNTSIDLITTRTAARAAPTCGGGGGGRGSAGSAAMLETLTLWGCMRLKHLNFGTTDPTLCSPATLTGGGGGGNAMATSSGSKLVSLNLWGCHSLTDDWASALSGMHNLKSLVVSECHRLTDPFVLTLTQTVPQLHHLFLRYCKRLTDNAVDAIALNMPNLYSLDLSFCSRLSAGAIVRLLDMRWETLAELRLQSCNLQIANMHQDTGRLNSNSNAGRQILHSLRRHGSGADHGGGAGGCCLSVLDVRPSLVGSNDTLLAYDDPFVQGMKALAFEQSVPSCFVRPARWSPQVEQVLSNPSFSQEY